MKALIAGLLVCGMLLATAIIYALIKRNRASVYSLMAVVLLCAGTGGYTIYKVIVRVQHAFTPRTGMQIYTALLGKPEYDCVKVINQQDQVIPKIDYAIWLYFETCPKELSRVLARHSYTVKPYFLTHTHSDDTSSYVNWFQPDLLQGDSARIFEWRSEDQRNISTLYVSWDSTKVYCQDILD